MKSLKGDASDNIPGIPGVGEKTASSLIREYGSLEGVVEKAENLKGKLRENIEAYKEQGFLSKKLATIIVDAPVEFSEEDLQLEDPDTLKLKEVFNELEFRTLSRRILGEEQEPDLFF